MKYGGMPALMWLLYKKSFRNSLISVLNYDSNGAKEITGKAYASYKKILLELPSFEKKDGYVTNIINCALLISFIINMPNRPTVEKLTEYYDQAMRTKMTEMVCRKAGKSKFSQKTIDELKEGALKRWADRNEYSWNYEFRLYSDGSGYEAKYTRCGICTLMKKYGCYDLVPAMCHLDYTMNELGKGARFVREYTLASGGPYCDCGYKKPEFN